MTNPVNKSAEMVVATLRESDYSASSNFKSAWRTFVEAVLTNPQNIDMSGLIALHSALGASRMSKERLFIYSYIVRLLPQSHESHCHLAYAYRDCEQPEMALKHFDKAIEFSWGHAQKEGLRLDDCQKQDIASYMRNAAEMECGLGCPEAACMRMIEANDLVKGHRLIEGDMQHIEEVTGMVLLGLGFSD